MDQLLNRFKSLLNQVVGKEENGPSSARVYPPDQGVADQAHVGSMERYREMYRRSVEDPAGFWSQLARELHWESPPPADGTFVQYNFDQRHGPIFIRWMPGGRTNVCYNAVDRHVKDNKGGNVAFYWEGNDPADHSQITYAELLREVCRFSNVLKSKGVQRGDRVALYMPMVIEAVVAMLACARIGAVHSVVFGGFSADSLADRILNAKCKVLVTADGVWRGDKLVHLKEICDTAMKLCEKQKHHVDAVIVVRHLPRLNASGGDMQDKSVWVNGRDFWWQEEMAGVSDQCEPEWMDSEDPLFMLYTSGSTGTPKGVLHTTAGYLLYGATTFKYVFDYHPGEVFWCTADIGWITGHTYVVYGPLANGATSVLFEGTPFYPTKSRFWAVIEKYKVNKFYTAPTAIRALMKFGDEPVREHNRDSLKVLGTVGEPINPEAWMWYYNVVGNGSCPIVDTFWQTETGGHVLTPLPGCTPTKPGSACFPFFGVLPAILDENGKEVEGPGEGYLVFKKPWPGIMRTVYGNHERFEQTYFHKFPGYYCTGDGAKRDADGYYWITGRIDDMLNVSGHLLSTAQVESAIIEHKGVAEAAVVPHPHEVKGECLYCFVTTKDGIEFTPELVGDIKSIVREKIGPFATPEYIQHAPALPKTRSGKIMRRVLRKISRNERDLGDISTLADEAVIEILFSKRPPNVKV